MPLTYDTPLLDEVRAALTRLRHPEYDAANGRPGWVISTLTVDDAEAVLVTCAGACPWPYAVQPLEEDNLRRAAGHARQVSKYHRTLRDAFTIWRVIAPVPGPITQPHGLTRLIVFRRTP